MNHFEVDELLSSLEILVDTREQDTAKARRRYAAFGVPYRRTTLAYGDYCGNVRLPNGEYLLDATQAVQPRCMIERKMNLDELAQCLTRGRERFKREFERAAANHCRIYLLCEDGNIEKILRHEYRSKFNPSAFLASVVAWSIRYNMQLVFCSHISSGRLIKEIIYRDLKERAEMGEFDV